MTATRCPKTSETWKHYKKDSMRPTTPNRETDEAATCFKEEFELPVWVGAAEPDSEPET